MESNINIMEFDIEKLCGFDGPSRSKLWYNKHVKYTETRFGKGLLNITRTLDSPGTFTCKRFYPLLSQKDTLWYLIELLELEVHMVNSDQIPKEGYDPFSKGLKITSDHINNSNGHKIIQELFKLRRFFRELLVFPAGTSFRFNSTGISHEWLEKIEKRTGWIKKKKPSRKITQLWENEWYSTLILTKCDWAVRQLIYKEFSLKFKLPKDVCNLIWEQIIKINGSTPIE